MDMGDIFGDIFGDFFGGGSRRRNNGPMKGANVRSSVRITFEEAVFGCEKEIEVVLKDECKTCGGTGAKPEQNRRHAAGVAVQERLLIQSSRFLGLYRTCRLVRNVLERERSFVRNARIAAEQDILRAERKSRSRFLQELTMVRASASGIRASRE